MKRETQAMMAKAAVAGFVLAAATALAAPGWGEEQEQEQKPKQEQQLERRQKKDKEQKQERKLERAQKKERVRGGERGRDRRQDVRGPAARVIRVVGRELRLTREQKQSLRDLVRERSADLRGAAREIGEARRGLREIVLADTSDETAIRGAAERLGAAIGSASLLGARLAGEVRPALTPEQRDRLRKMSTRWDSRRDRWRQRFERWEQN